MLQRQSCEGCVTQGEGWKMTMPTSMSEGLDRTPTMQGRSRMRKNKDKQPRRETAAAGDQPDWPEDASGEGGPEELPSRAVKERMMFQSDGLIERLGCVRQRTIA